MRVEKFPGMTSPVEMLALWRDGHVCEGIDIFEKPSSNDDPPDPYFFWVQPRNRLMPEVCVLPLWTKYFNNMILAFMM